MIEFDIIVKGIFFILLASWFYALWRMLFKGDKW